MTDYFDDPINQVNELKFISDKTPEYSETLTAIAESIEVKTMHGFKPTEFGGDTCSECGHDIRIWAHTRF